MSTKKLPEPLVLPSEEKNTCTCDKYEWDEHDCPYAEDVNKNPDFCCNCCPECKHQCLRDI